LNEYGLPEEMRSRINTRHWYSTGTKIENLKVGLESQSLSQA
jgi:hypothetical protein